MEIAILDENEARRQGEKRLDICKIRRFITLPRELILGIFDRIADLIDQYAFVISVSPSMLDKHVSLSSL